MHRSHIDPNGKDGVATGGGGMSSNGSLSGAASSASISGTDSIDGNNGVGGNDSTANTLQDSLNEKLSKVEERHSFWQKIRCCVRFIEKDGMMKLNEYYFLK